MINIPYRSVARQNPENLGLKFDTLRINGFNDIDLNGYFFYSTKKVEGTIIFSHGIGGNKEHFYHEVQKVCDLGFNALVYDIRAHGSSGGNFGSYGFYEKYDLQHIINFLEENYNCTNIGAWGVSYGAAITIQAMAIDKRIRFGLIQSTFTDLRTIVNDYHDRVLHVHIPGLANNALDRAAEEANFDPGLVSPFLSSQTVTQPTFVAHGTLDKHISFRYGQQNFKALASKDKIWYPVKGAAHNNLPMVGGEVYWEACKDFLNTYGKR